MHPFCDRHRSPLCAVSTESTARQSQSFSPIARRDPSYFSVSQFRSNPLSFKYSLNFKV